MIRLAKPKKVPSKLKTRGASKTRELQDAYDAGQREFSDFDQSIYGDKAVKESLRVAQHGKCAFCESKIAHISYGDVEHYRPKAAVAQQEGDPLERPGYYWLAYQWANLLFCCQLCNQRFKRCLFPLRAPSRRARSHHDELTQEEPLLLDPTATDPTLHLRYRNDTAFAFAVNGSEEGQVTIDVMGLNRVELLEKRRDALRPLRVIWGACQVLYSIQAKDGALPPELQAVLSMHENELQTAQLPRPNTPRWPGRSSSHPRLRTATASASTPTPPPRRAARGIPSCDSPPRR